MKYSLEHIIFLKKNKKTKLIVLLSQLSIIIIFFLTWEILTKYSIINSFLYSSPSRVFNTLTNLGIQEFGNHLFITLYEIIISFIVSSILAFLIASLFWTKTIISKICDPFLTIINSLPKVALGPLFIIWIGTSIHSIIFMSLTISLFTTIINIYQGFISVDYKYLIMLKSFKAKKVDIFKKVILPINIPNIITALKVNVSLNLIGVIMGELLVSKRGLGYLIMYGSQVFKLDLVISSVFLLGIISYLLYLGLNTLYLVYNKKFK